jgi:MYXO-CTERM domain-containing protein
MRRPPPPSPLRLLLAFALPALGGTAAADPVTFRAEVPHCTPPGDTVLLRSNRLDPEVFQHDPMTRVDGTLWELTTEVLTPLETFEYKYAHAPCDEARCTGIEKALACGGSADEIAPRRLSSGQLETQDLVFVWRDAVFDFDPGGVLIGPRSTPELASFCGPYLGVRSPLGELGLGHDTFAPGDVVVEYGPDTGYGRSDLQAGTHRHRLSLMHLPPDAEVHYRVVLDGVPGPDRTFLSPPGPQGVLRFVHLGDAQYQGALNREQTRALAELALAFRPHLVLGTGDMVQSSYGVNGYLPPEVGRWNVFFGCVAELLARAPYATAMGNHEEDGPYFWDAFIRPVTDPPRLDHYDFRLGHTQFFVLYTGSTSGYDAEGILEVQTPWLEARLQAAAADPAVRWKVVALHRGPFNQSAYHLGDGARFAEGGTATRPSWRSLWERYGVDLVLAGHTHDFSLAAVNGIHYLTECGGAPTYPLLEPWAPTTLYAEATCSLAQLTASPRTLSLRSFRPDGSEIVEARLSLCHADGDCGELADPCPPPEAARWSCRQRACQATCATPADGGEEPDGADEEVLEDGADGVGTDGQDQAFLEDVEGGRVGGGGCACGATHASPGPALALLALGLAFVQFLRRSC